MRVRDGGRGGRREGVSRGAVLGGGKGRQGGRGGLGGVAGGRGGNLYRENLGKRQKKERGTKSFVCIETRIKCIGCFALLGSMRCEHCIRS